MSDDEIKIENDAAEIAPNDAPIDDVELVADEEYGDEAGEGAVAKLRAKLKDSQAKCSEYVTGWQRAKADYVNAKRQNDEERVEFLKYSERRLMLELLTLADSFDLALGDLPTGQAGTSGTPPNSEKWLAGVKNIRSQLEKILAGHGVKTQEDQVGKKFDPALHEALMSEPVTDEAQDDTVLAELAKGYLIHDQVLRPAKVKVGEYRAQE
ncbi:MAG: nucleotide exchange factor GrpE [Candidatus Niyogibacteria bacterium]|nr:nucleotide exchange factor GrpE [Candidatus Niyogibacteria bacterium]